jgi:hypothetical protein
MNRAENTPKDRYGQILAASVKIYDKNASLLFTLRINTQLPSEMNNYIHGYITFVLNCD